VTGGSDVRLEHEVKLDRGSQLIAGSGVPDVVLLDEFTKLGTTKVVNLQVSFIYDYRQRWLT